MPLVPITKIYARQILDSRGNPTIEVTVEAGRAVGIFGVPSGASTGCHEALELRDNARAFFGKSVTNAVRNVNEKIARQIRGMNVYDQKKIDAALIELDGTPNKCNLGANAILGISGAVTKTAANAKQVPVYKYVAFLYKKKGWKMPKPMINVINGGEHGDSNLDIQETLLMPLYDSIAKNIECAADVFHNLKKVLTDHKKDTDLGNEGGYSPDWESNEEALKLTAEAVKASGLKLGKELSLGLDIAASTIYDKNTNQYALEADHTSLTAERLISMYKDWVSKYSIISIEDGLGEDDWEGWRMMAKRLNQTLQVGDDLFVTNVERLKMGIEKKVANAIIIKPNQVGTITETLDTVSLAQKNGYKIIASHRSGETTDDFIADLAVGIGADFIKAGSVARGERVVKYNRLMQIEHEMEINK